MKRFAALTLAVVLIIGGCSVIGPSAEDYAREFLECLAAGKYKEAYALTWEYSVNRPDEAAFAEKYQGIADALDLSSYTWSEFTRGESDDYRVPLSYTATLETKYGTFTDKFTMTLYPADDGYRVDWSPSLIFPEMDWTDTLNVSTQKGKRGEIFTSDGKLAAANTYAQTVYLDMERLTEDKLTYAADIINAVLSVDSAAVTEKYQKAVTAGSKVAVIAVYSPGTLTEEQKTALRSAVGVGVDESGMTPVRAYPLGEIAAHTVGYATESSAEDVAALGSATSFFTGRTGIEQTYNEILSESGGVSVTIRDALGYVKRTLYEQPAQNGEDVYLTYDSKLQERAYLSLVNFLNEDQTGAVVILNADTGAVLAAASYPSYDPNDFVPSVSEEVWAALTAKDAGTPLYSRFSQGAYPPGSSLKPFTIVPALESGEVDAGSVFPYSADVEGKKWTPTNEEWHWPPITRKDAPDNPVNLTNAMKISDNIYFAWTALKVGEERLCDYLERIGIDTAIDTDIPVSKGNIVNDSTDFNRRLVAEMGYGQGEILITPVQLAAMYTAFLNGGDILAPYFVEKTMGGEDYSVITQREREVLISDAIADSTVGTLLPILKLVMSEGTGRGANIAGAALAGKTGTAEIGTSKTREIGWIIAFYTEGSDRRLVLTMVDGPAAEGATKLAVTRELLKYGMDAAE